MFSSNIDPVGIYVWRKIHSINRSIAFKDQMFWFFQCQSMTSLNQSLFKTH